MLKTEMVTLSEDDSAWKKHVQERAWEGIKSGNLSLWSLYLDLVYGES